MRVATLLLLNGPNLNLLGSREPGIYGDQSLDRLEASLIDEAGDAGHSLVAFQSNHEGELIDRIHAAGQNAIDFILINPAALTHTSIALRDALLAVDIPFIEIHLSNVHARESFRHTSFLSDIAVGVIAGLGPIGYSLALRAAISQLTTANPKG